METHVWEYLPDFVLGSLPDEDYHMVAVHLAACEECMAACQKIEETMGYFSFFAPFEPPPGDLRSRVLSQFSGGQRFSMYAPQVAVMLGLDIQRTEEFFELLDDLEHWKPGPSPGSYLLPIKGSKKAFFTGFIRLEPDVVFPSHEHHGREHLFLLAGGYTDDEGNTFQSGEEDIHESASSHEIKSMPWVPCICALVIENGFQFLPPKP